MPRAFEQIHHSMFCIIPRCMVHFTKEIRRAFDLLPVSLLPQTSSRDRSPEHHSAHTTAVRPHCSLGGQGLRWVLGLVSWMLLPGACGLQHKAQRWREDCILHSSSAESDGGT